MDFYKRLNYSLGNEDWNVEEQALRIKSGDRVICVTASGDRSLHLLMTECASITSIDMNSIQTYLLELKLAAITQLDYEKYLGFLGASANPHRKAIYQTLRSHLSLPARVFWDNHLKMIEKGIIYQGTVERFTRLTSHLFKLFKKESIHKLFAFTDIQEQREFVKQELGTFFLKELLSIFFNKRVAKFVSGDPGVVEADLALNPPVYIYKKIENYLNHQLARTSPLLQLILMGHILPDAYFPYLTYQGYQRIRTNPARLTYVTDNIIKTLENSDSDRFDCFSLSDIASYMPQNTFNQLLRGITKAAKPGARFCLREFLSNRLIPTEFHPIFQRQSALEKKLEEQESNFVYRFFVGDIATPD